MGAGDKARGPRYTQPTMISPRKNRSQPHSVLEGQRVSSRSGRGRPSGGEGDERSKRRALAIALPALLALALILGLVATLGAQSGSASAAAPQAPSPMAAGATGGPDGVAGESGATDDKALAPLSGSDALSAQRVAEATEGLPEDVRRRALDSLPRMRVLLSELGEMPKDYLILVDKEGDHTLPADYVPEDLVPLEGTGLKTTKAGLKLRSFVIPAAQEMAAAAKKKGYVLEFSSTFRSFEYQQQLFARYVKEMGQKEAERVSAHAGRSQHQLGTAIDFGSVSDAYGNTPPGKWMLAHAWEYGFSLSYPAGMEKVTGYRTEVWHYRYIGKSLCRLEKEVFGSQQYMMVFLQKLYGRPEIR
jgi:zinc D-Ala-D-Ala carboxypeptidase